MKKINRWRLRQKLRSRISRTPSVCLPVGEQIVKGVGAKAIVSLSMSRLWLEDNGDQIKLHFGDAQLEPEE